MSQSYPGPYNPIEVDVNRVRLPGETPMPDQAMRDLVAILSFALGFKNVQVKGPQDAPEFIAPSPERPLMLPRVESDEPARPGASAGTLGVRQCRRQTISLRTFLNSINRPSREVAELTLQLSVLIQRVIVANAYLPDTNGNNQFQMPILWLGSKREIHEYGTDERGRKLYWRTIVPLISWDLTYAMYSGGAYVQR